MPPPLLHVHLGQNLKECKQDEAMIEDMGNCWMYQPLKLTHLEMTHLEMTHLGDVLSTLVSSALLASLPSNANVVAVVVSSADNAMSGGKDEPGE